MKSDFEKRRKRQVQAKRRQEKPWVQWYRTPAWRRARSLFLGENPWCAICNAPSEVVDHKEPHHGVWERFWDESTWVPLCKPCHDRKTAKQDGGFGNRSSDKPDAACNAEGLPLDPGHPWRKNF